MTKKTSSNTPKPVSVTHSKDGDITNLGLSDGRNLTIKQAIVEARKGNISGVHVVNAKAGAYVRSNPNGVVKDNLDNLPEGPPRKKK